MSKIYFAKWLPVQGKIGIGDYGMDLKRGGEVSGPSAVGWSDKATNPLYSPVRKAKLFLCSHDIKVGDEVWFLDPNPNDSGFKDWSGVGTVLSIEDDYVCVDLGHTTTCEVVGQFLKKVGEISPEAYSYVKEGDEFDSEELLANEFGGTSIRRNIEDIRPQFVGTAEILIKGPCGHFH